MIRFITINDIVEFKPMSLNTDVNKKLNFCIDEAQKYDIAPFLGDNLYLLMEENFNVSPQEFSGVYVDLFEGSDYEYGVMKFRHGGIKAMLVYYAYARYVQGSNVNASAFGLVEKTNDHSTGVSEKTLSKQIANAVALAEAERIKVEQYIRYNISKYPSWVYANKFITPATSGLKINAVGGSRRAKEGNRNLFSGTIVENLKEVILRSGDIDGTNNIFNWVEKPTLLFLQGQKLNLGVDYTLTGNSSTGWITTLLLAPVVDDVLIAYR